MLGVFGFLGFDDEGFKYKNRKMVKCKEDFGSEDFEEELKKKKKVGVKKKFVKELLFDEG